MHVIGIIDDEQMAFNINNNDIADAISLFIETKNIAEPTGLTPYKTVKSFIAETYDERVADAIASICELIVRHYPNVLIDNIIDRIRDNKYTIVTSDNDVVVIAADRDFAINILFDQYGILFDQYN